jgi:hypothetical protein
VYATVQGLTVSALAFPQAFKAKFKDKLSHLGHPPKQQQTAALRAGAIVASNNASAGVLLVQT